MLSTFEENRRRLWSIAYRMLGSRADADDAVQDAYLRWHGARVDEIRSPQAWLVTTVTRLCIDRLKQLRAERERYTGPWLPEPLVAEAPAADQATELASDLSVALLAVLERLAPEERAAFLLHEMFDSDYGDIAQILGKSEVATRQIVSRARKARARGAPTRACERRCEESGCSNGLVKALQTQDKDALLELLAEGLDAGRRMAAARRRPRAR